MLWYRDFLVGKLSKDEFEKYLGDAEQIEEFFTQYPGLLENIQQEVWWQKYIRGETNPSDIFRGNTQALVDIQTWALQNPTLYEKVKMNPNWNTGVQFGEDYIVVGQKEFLLSLNLWLGFLDKHPEIEGRLAENGFSRENLFFDDWSKDAGIYGFLEKMKDTKAP